MDIIATWLEFPNVGSVWVWFFFFALHKHHKYPLMVGSPWHAVLKRSFSLKPERYRVLSIAESILQQLKRGWGDSATLPPHKHIPLHPSPKSLLGSTQPQPGSASWSITISNAIRAFCYCLVLHSSACVSAFPELHHVSGSLWSLTESTGTHHQRYAVRKGGEIQPPLPSLLPSLWLSTQPEPSIQALAGRTVHCTPLAIHRRIWTGFSLLCGSLPLNIVF